MPFFAPYSSLSSGLYAECSIYCTVAYVIHKFCLPRHCTSIAVLTNGNLEGSRGGSRIFRGSPGTPSRNKNHHKNDHLESFINEKFGPHVYVTQFLQYRNESNSLYYKDAIIGDDFVQEHESIHDGG